MLSFKILLKPKNKFLHLLLKKGCSFLFQLKSQVHIPLHGSASIISILSTEDNHSTTGSPNHMHYPQVCNASKAYRASCISILQVCDASFGMHIDVFIMVFMAGR